MQKNVLITGGSGLLGTRLTPLLMQKGYHISHLSRNKQPGDIPSYQWDVEGGVMDRDVLTDTDIIIHLAGAGIADKRWSPKRKKEILESRIKSSALLYKMLKETPHRVRTFVSASAIGIYGYAGSEKLFDEDSEPASDFLVDVVKRWEASVDQISSLGIRVVKIRIGILLSNNGGALYEMAKPIKWGLGAPLGSGDQLISWIHIDDVCGIFNKAIEDESMHGAFNAVSPKPATNKELTLAIARTLGKPQWLPNVPGVVLKLALGEMANLVLKGSYVSAKKIQQAGFKFLFTDLEKALRDLLEQRLKV